MAVASTSSSPQVLLQGVSWATYQALSQDLDSDPGKRLTYDRRKLEIMGSLPPHETYKKRLGRLVEVTTEETTTKIRSLGSTNWSREDLQRGLEYYIQNEQAEPQRLHAQAEPGHQMRLLGRACGQICSGEAEDGLT